MASSHGLRHCVPFSNGSETKGKGEGDVGETVSRRLFVMRHGERCDFTFGRKWLKASYDDKGKYHQQDLNLPVTMVDRKTVTDFYKDTPLTEVGRLQARLTGQAMRRNGVDLRHVYVSPALRCIQTAQGVLDGYGNPSLRMRIEPTAFEWFGWYKNALPPWLSASQLIEEGYSVDLEHKPFFAMKDINLEENLPQYYNRSYRLANAIVDAHQNDGDMLVVAHAGSLDTVTRQLVGKVARTSSEVQNMMPCFSYCCLCCCVPDTSGKWKLAQPPIPPLHEFNWTILQ